MAALLGVAIYLSLDTSSFNYEFTPAWYYDQPARSTGMWRQLAPEITDLDGDGRNEIIFIDKNMMLTVRAELSIFIISYVFTKLRNLITLCNRCWMHRFLMHGREAFILPKSAHPSVSHP